jgi:hypothetical protein
MGTEPKSVYDCVSCEGSNGALMLVFMSPLDGIL